MCPWLILSMSYIGILSLIWVRKFERQEKPITFATIISLISRLRTRWKAVRTLVTPFVHGTHISFDLIQLEIFSLWLFLAICGIAFLGVWKLFILRDKIQFQLVCIKTDRVCYVIINKAKPRQWWRTLLYYLVSFNVPKTSNERFSQKSQTWIFVLIWSLNISRDLLRNENNKMSFI